MKNTTTTNATQTAHTPGPWELWTFGETCQTSIGEKSGGVSVCEVTMSDGEGRQTKESTDRGCANARIIAAAPELLAALEAAVAYLEANRPQGKIRDIFSALNHYENDVMKPARAAIAKATGGAK
jgi:hypothetical protein